MKVTVFGALLSISAAVQALNPIVIQGSRFFDSVTKDQFFIKGVAYQPRGEAEHLSRSAIDDPLADPTACARDAELMKSLGLNVLRVYEVDPSKNHDPCMKSFADAGIYLLLDIATPKFSINRNAPEYDGRLYNAYTKTVAAFVDYPNMLGFVAGNEVTNDKTNTLASAYVKAAVRDVKRYLKESQKRPIPVGYASNDDEFIRDAIKDYFGCGEPEEQVDFFGVNMYEWCGDSTFQKSGYADRTREFENYTKPVFLSEYGCNLVSPREFTEVAAIYSPDMTGVWSGGVVYEWTQENNNYGLVSISAGQASPLPDYRNLQQVLSQVKPQGIKMDQHSPAATTLTCPGQTENWKASSRLPPTPSDGACRCMRDNLSCVASDKLANTASASGGNSTLNPTGDQIDMLCGLVSCDDIGGDAEKGTYGAYSFCSPAEKLSWLYQLYMKTHPNGQCDFDGHAQMARPSRKDLDICSNIQPGLKGGGSPGGSGTDKKDKKASEGPTLPPPGFFWVATFLVSFII